MNKRKYAILSILIALSAAALIFFYTRNSQLSENDGAPKVCIKNKCFNVEIAQTQKEKEAGLMNRKYLDPDKGMLFLFKNEGIYNFWMKNTLIPLDIIWIDKNKKVVFIKENAMPCNLEDCETFYPTQKAKYVLEINGGLAEKYGLKVGDEVEIALPKS